MSNLMPTIACYEALYAAYDHFNTELFESRLPPCILVLARKRNARGYFWAGRWHDRSDEDQTPILDEIALNPDAMGRTTAEVLSTLVHEMVHLEQEHYGKPGKTGHNKEWAEWMDRVGLTPSNTGAPGGKRTGRQMTHYIEPDGPFAAAFAALEATGFVLPWASAPQAAGPKKIDKSKMPFCCPDCGQKAWAKESAALWCGACETPMEIESK